MRAVKRPKERPASWKTMRLVRLETGMSSEAVLARWTVEIEYAS